MGLPTLSLSNAARVTICAAAASMASTAAAQTGTFLDDGGIVCVQFESGVAADDWTLSTATPGFTDEGYFIWTGPDLFNSPGASGVFSFDLEVETGGQWFLALRNRHEDPDATEQNDVWIRMDSGPWIKVFSNMPGSVGAWTWESRFDLDHGNQPTASYNLTPGAHTIQFSGRSFGFKMDSFHLYKAGNANALDPSYPESDRRFGEAYCVAANNSTGQVSTVAAIGSPEVALNDVTLETTGLPQSTLGYYIVSAAEAYVVGVGGSDGNLCVGAGTGRYAGNVLSSGMDGSVELLLDLSSIPQPTGSVAVSAGETWRFQYWHRDTNMSGPTSNFSRGIRVTFE